MERIATLIGGIAALVVPRPADAFVRQTVPGTTTPFQWSQSCVQMIAYPADFVAHMPLDEIMSAVTWSANQWSAMTDPCTYLDVTAEFSTAAVPRRSPSDRRSMIIFRTTSWCPLLEDGSCNPQLRPYDPAALALTTVSARTSSGQIVEADIEVNVVDFEWADLVAHPPGGSTPLHDLANALTHEMGHVLGFGHTCFVPDGIEAHPIDHTGAPVVECADASPEVRRTTMFPSADTGDVEKRSLEPDDRLAVCTVYPAASDPGVCPAPGGGNDCGCRATGRPEKPTAAGLAAAAAAAWLWRRRRRSR
jgi:MYXO-CTERM domain-containing protein